MHADQPRAVFDGFNHAVFDILGVFHRAVADDASGVDTALGGSAEERVYRFVRDRLLAGNPPTIRNAVLTEDGTTLQSFDVDLGLVNGPSKEFGTTRTNTYQGALGARWETGNAVFTTDLAYTKSTVDGNWGQFQTQVATPLSLSASQRWCCLTGKPASRFG